MFWTSCTGGPELEALQGGWWRRKYGGGQGAGRGSSHTFPDGVICHGMGGGQAGPQDPLSMGGEEQGDP